MNVIVIEDEPLVAREMQKIIERVDPSIKIRVVLSSVKEAVKWLGENQMPDLIFSDIQLSDGISFDIFESVKVDVPIVFTTAYSEYTLRAFKLNSIDYLLKPIDDEALHATLEKFKKLHAYTQKPPYNEMLRQVLIDFNTREIKKYKHRFLTHQGSSIIPVDESNVSMFTFEKMVFIHTLDNKQLVTDYHSLEELESLLDPKHFFRANRQHIIHINAVDSIKLHHTGKLQVFMKKPVNVEISVSREKAGAFKQWFEQE